MSGGALLRGAVCAALLVCGGCAETNPLPVDFADATRAYRAADYPRVRDGWTRRGKLITDAGTVLEASATFKTSDFRQAYVEYYGDAYGLSESDRQTLRQSQLEAASRTFEFHVCAESTNFKWNDLEKKTSPWRVTLVDGTGVEISPDSIETPKLPELYESQFFPMRTAFSRTYVLRFSRAPRDTEGPPFAGTASGRLILRFASPAGRVDLVWQGQ